MMRSGIPAAPTAVALLINLVLYTLSILLMAAAGLALHPGLLKLFGPASRILIWSARARGGAASRADAADFPRADLPAAGGLGAENRP